MALELPTVLIIPSGIGCSLGGYAGDAIPAARLLAAASGCLITHPNVMNGASLYWSDPRVHYVEGYGLDHFLTGEFLLRPVRTQQVGLLLDAGLDKELRERHLQVAAACKASLGLNIGPVVTTEVPLEIQLHKASSGSSWGELATADSLLKAGKELQDAGATAIAVVTRFPDVVEQGLLDAYLRGEGIDIFAGAEAIISHLLTRFLSLPCAHAPALSLLPLQEVIDPRSAAEELGHTFLPCVLVGLSRAPDLVKLKKEDLPSSFKAREFLSVAEVGALVAPEGALGSEAVLACLERNIPLIVVSNKNVLNVSSQALELKGGQFNDKNQVLYASNYVEAAGLILALRDGINIDSLYRPMPNILQIS